MTDDPWRRPAYAVKVADHLAARRGDAALRIAQDRLKAAIAAGKIARADLYQAVCTILTDRHQVYTRWKLHQVPGGAGSSRPDPVIALRSPAPATLSPAVEDPRMAARRARRPSAVAA